MIEQLTYQPAYIEIFDGVFLLDSDHTLRLGDSRVSLDAVIEEYESGATPEEIVFAYDTLSLPLVSTAIACYLKNPSKVKAYMARQEVKALELRRQIESRQPPTPSMEALEARLRAKETAHAQARK